MPDAIGWLATAVFSVSYLFKSASALRWVQALAALLWIAYGLTISSKPVVGANLIVALAAVASALSGRAAPPDPGSDAGRHRSSQAGSSPS